MMRSGYMHIHERGGHINTTPNHVAVTLKFIKTQYNALASILISIFMNYSWSKLSPASQQMHQFNVVKERRNYLAKAKQLSSISS